MVGAREWADVFVAPGQLRDDLDRAALFYVPEFYNVAHSVGLNLSNLNSVSATLKLASGHVAVAGRQAIQKVWSADQPVSYSGAIGSVAVLNSALKSRGSTRRLGSADI